MPLTFQWFHNDQKLAGQHDSTLLLNCLTLEMDGEYVCKVANSVKEILSEV
jgi:hypothetical protein